jgi:dipeptidase E
VAVRARRRRPRDRRLFDLPAHLDVFPENTLAKAERWAADIGGPAYAIDDQTAIKVTDRTVEVVSEGRWKLFP